MTNQKGFIQIIVILILILVIIGLLGLDAPSIWENIFKPIFTFIGDFIVSAARFVTELVKLGWSYIK